MSTFKARFLHILILVCLLLALPGGTAQAAPGDTTIVSLTESPYALPTDADSASPSLSDDGRFVVFESGAGNLVSGDTNHMWDIFIHDRLTGMRERASLGLSGAEANGDSRSPSISADGRYVAFMSYASNLVSDDTNGKSDIFVHDRQTGLTKRVSIGPSGVEANNDSNFPSISADGRYVTFESWASNLVSSNMYDMREIFVHDRQTEMTKRVSIGPSGAEANGDSRFPSISADGCYVAFMSYASNLVIDDTNGLRDIFVNDCQTGLTKRVSIGLSGVDANNDSNFPSISSDGRYVAFESGASNLVSGDTNEASDIFVYDLASDVTERTSLGLNGGQANGDSRTPSISTDGRYVAFSSDASNPVSGDTNGMEDIFVYDRTVHATQRVSLGPSAGQANGNSWEPSISPDGNCVSFTSSAGNLVSGDKGGDIDIFVHDSKTSLTDRVTFGPLSRGAIVGSETPSISADGRYVAFETYANNMVSGDTDWDSDIFVHDRLTGVTECVSLGPGGEEANEGSFYPSISADGRYVAFRSRASNLVSGDTNGDDDIFVHDRQTRVTERVSVDSSGGQANAWSEYPSISADGRYVAFMSGATNLVSGDTNEATDIFVHDRQTGLTERVSVDSSGGQANAWSEGQSISADGSTVAFASFASNLVSGDTNGMWDIFVHDRQTGLTERVSVDSSGGQANAASGFMSLSADGRYVAFESEASNLVSGDTNETEDIFVHNLETGLTGRVSLGSDGIESNGGSSFPSISNDGRYVAFESVASNLVSGDTNEASDIFVYDRENGLTNRASVDSSGGEADSVSNTPSISADGSAVAFASYASNLVEGDVNVARDIFVHENDLITLMVNKTEDTDDGSCNNDCSLREAIGAVSAGGTVTFAPALAGQTIPLSSTITIDKNLIIDGSDLVPHVQVSGDTDDNGMGDISLFQIAEGKTVEITSLDIIKGLSTLWSTGGGITNRGDLTLTNCSFVGNNGQQGGAIRNAGSLTISNCSFTENAAKDGGAIYNDINKIIQISDSSFTMNTADYAAGAILNVGTLSATGSEFSNNSGGIAGGGGAIVNSLLGSVSLQDNTFTDNSTAWYGGAINNYSGTLTVTDCTFSGNSAEGGGAINAGNDDHTPESNNIRIENSTFSENTATFIAGGGLHVFSGNAIVNGSTFSNNLAPEGGGVVNLASALQISNSTFYNNTSIESPLGGIYNNGSITVKNVTISEKDGGLYNASGGTLELQNTILANSITGYDCYNAGTLTNATNNLIEANSSGEFACGTPVSSADPLLGPLADNGGPTQTMALRPGSPAIDAGDDTNCPPTDQRGKARPQNAHCDIGAFELELNLTFVVNSSLDIVDANQGDGVCETSTGNGLCTLRAAIQEANANLGIDHIILPEGIYSLTLPEPVGTIENAAANGDLDILDTLFLSGAGSASTVIDGNGDVTQDRVFDIRGNHDVEISNLTIRGGNPAPNNGGGIYNRGGMLTLNTIVLRDNTAGLGGGLINVGTTHLINSSIESNTATDNGGGIRNDLALFIVNSSVSGNTSRSAGGGIITHGLLQVTNSTISGNQTEDDRGGGIFVGNTLVGEPDPTVNLNNVTIVNNLADSDGNGNGDGGGIYLRENGTVYLRNTILAGNAGPNGVSECSGTLTSKGHNLIEKTGNCIIIGSTTGNLVGVDPNLGPLADNGGPTQSMALLPGSPAIDAGDNTACPSADQRGAARPQDGDNNGSLICDIGAYEVEPDTTPPNVSSIVRADTDPTSATSIDFTVTFSEPVSGVDASDFKLAKTGSISSYAITGVSPATGPADTYTVSVATGKYNGTLRLDLLDDDSIKDGGGNPLGGAGNGNGDFISGEAYTITKKYTSTLKSIATQDGWLLESSETSNKGGTLDKTANLFYLGDNAQNKQYRSVLSFSTKGLPDDARVTKVTLKIRKQGIVGSGNPVNLFQGFLVDVKQGFFGTAAGLQASNFQAKADQSIGPFKPTLISGWYALNLTSAKAYINKKATGGGVTQIRLRFKLDDNNNSIANNLKLYSGDAPAASHPQLILEYYVP